MGRAKTRFARVRARVAQAPGALDQSAVAVALVDRGGAPWSMSVYCCRACAVSPMLALAALSVGAVGVVPRGVFVQNIRLDIIYIMRHR